MQRNGQNPIRKTAMPFSGAKVNSNEPGRRDNSTAVYFCGSCGKSIEPKPGFRIGSLKCKCGGSPVRKD